MKLLVRDLKKQWTTGSFLALILLPSVHCVQANAYALTAHYEGRKTLVPRACSHSLGKEGEAKEEWGSERGKNIHDTDKGGTKQQEGEMSLSQRNTFDAHLSALSIWLTGPRRLRWEDPGWSSSSSSSPACKPTILCLLLVPHSLSRDRREGEKFWAGHIWKRYVCKLLCGRFWFMFVFSKSCFPRVWAGGDEGSSRDYIFFSVREVYPVETGKCVEYQGVTLTRLNS